MIQRQFIKFIVIGVFSTVINYGIFFILYHFIAVHYIASSAIGFMSGVFVGYHFNKNWTFGVAEKSPHYLYQYYLVYTISLVLGLGFLHLLVKRLDIIPEIANILTIGLTTCTNFLGTKFWVFKR